MDGMNSQEKNLDLLARFIGYNSFDQFCQQATESLKSTTEESTIRRLIPPRSVRKDISAAYIF